MYQDTFEDDDLIAEVELVAQARYSQNNDIDDGFDSEGTLIKNFFSASLLTLYPLQLVIPTQQQQATPAQIPDGVRNFILHFYRNVIDNNVYELHNIFDSSFNKLTEKYYQKQAWPEAEVIAPLVNDGKFIEFIFPICLLSNHVIETRPSILDFVPRTLLPSHLCSFDPYFGTTFPLLWKLLWSLQLHFE